MKKLFLLLLAMAIIAAPLSAYAADTPLMFRYGLLDEPPGIDPSISQGSTQSTLYGTLYEGLVRVDAQGNIIPAAAESWTSNDDKTEYTFTLREGLCWSDGKPVTAGDFAYAWLRVLTPETASTYSWFVEMFILNGSKFAAGEVGADEVGVKALDDRTLQVRLNSPASYFLQALLQGCFLPVRQDAVESDPEKWCFGPETAISNGPFKLKEYKIGSYFEVEKNESYWNAKNVTLDGIRFDFIADSNTALAAFEAGTMDGIAGVPAESFIQLMTTDARLYTYDRLAFNFLRLNTQTPGLDNDKVRRAISLVIDRRGYLDGLGSLTAIPALGSVPAGLVLAGQDFRDAAGDNGLGDNAKVEEARALLAEAGYPGGEGLPTFRLHCTESSLKGAQIIQQMLLEGLNIKTDILPVDAKLNFPTMVDGNYDIGFGGWGGDYTHPMTFLELFTTTAYDNCTRWSNARFDECIEKARVESDEATALALMVEAEHLLCQESPIVPLSFPSGAIMVQDGWSNWNITASDMFNISFATKG